MTETGSHLQVSDGEDHGVRQVHLVGVLVDGGRDDGRVDDDGVVGGQGVAAQLDGGVLRGQVNADVFVEDEGDPDLTCGKGNPIFVSRFFLRFGSENQKNTKAVWEINEPKAQ